MVSALVTLREKLKIPEEYPQEAVDDIRTVDLSEYPDRRDIPFVTIDPPGAADLDQAMHLSREGDGYLVRYAISAVGLFIEPGSRLDREVHNRGVTYYGPDGSIPLHPRELSAGVASLLEGEDRPAYLWYLHLDSEGALSHSWVELAVVRSRAQLTYEEVQESHDTGKVLADDVPADLTRLLAEIGRLRIHREIARGGISLDLPEQNIEAANGGYQLVYRAVTEIDEWNAQISLLTGMAAARMMLDAGVGILRTLPAAREKDYVRLRQVAHALDLDWPRDVSYPDYVRSLNSEEPKHAAFLNEAAGLFRGASYLALGVEEQESGRDKKNDGGKGGKNNAGKDAADKDRGDREVGNDVYSEHAAIASAYAHVTAPLRRLVDRYSLEVCRCLCTGEPIPQWVLDALPKLPKEMAKAGQRASNYENGAINALEGLILTGREGEVFYGVVVEASEPKEGSEKQRGSVMLSDPAVEASVTGKNLPVGTDVRVRLTEVLPTGPRFQLVKGKHAK